jgi:ubiquinone/menaquinone biosynthesis C-methylase UbiE
MQRTNEPQINTRTYWNYVYTTPAKNAEYWFDTRRFRTALGYVKDGDKVLDIGCGVGIFCRMAKNKRKGCEVWGSDISDEIIKLDKQMDPDINYNRGYAGLQTFLPDNHFNIVFSGEVIEHLDEPNQLFQEASRVMVKGGKLIITTPVEDHIVSAEHVWFFNRDDIKKFYTDNGFSEPEFIELDGMEHMVVIFAVGEKL